MQPSCICQMIPSGCSQYHSSKKIPLTTPLTPHAMSKNPALARRRNVQSELQHNWTIRSPRPTSIIAIEKPESAHSQTISLLLSVSRFRQQKREKFYILPTYFHGFDYNSPANTFFRGANYFSKGMGLLRLDFLPTHSRENKRRKQPPTRPLFQHTRRIHPPKFAQANVGGEAGTDYAEASSVKIRFLIIALPEPVFRYFSNSLAFLSLLTAM